MTRLLLSAALLALVTSVPASAAPADTGRIKVTVLLDGEPYTTGGEYCAVRPRKARRHGVNEKSIVGKCATANADGVAIIKRVPAGRVGVATVDGVGSCAYPKCNYYRRVRVRAGRTTGITWNMPMWGG